MPALRSDHWYAGPSRNAYIHRAWMRRGLPDSAFEGRPQIAIANTASGPQPWFGPTPPPLGFLTPKPSILDQAFDGPMEGHAPGMPWHYDLHVWIWKPNKSGMFTQFNPGLSC